MVAVFPHDTRLGKRILEREGAAASERNGDLGGVEVTGEQRASVP